MVHYVVSDASRRFMYILPTKEARDEMARELRGMYPLLTFYVGESDKHSGAVYWEMPKFPK